MSVAPLAAPLATPLGAPLAAPLAAPLVSTIYNRSGSMSEQKSETLPLKYRIASSKNAALETENAALETENAALETENAALKTKNAQLSAELETKMKQSSDYIARLIEMHKKEKTDLENQISVLTEKNKVLRSKCSRQDIAYEADPFACVANLYFIGHS